MKKILLFNFKFYLTDRMRDIEFIPYFLYVTDTYG